MQNAGPVQDRPPSDMRMSVPGCDTNWLTCHFLPFQNSASVGAPVATQKVLDRHNTRLKTGKSAWPGVDRIQRWPFHRSMSLPSPAAMQKDKLAHDTADRTPRGPVLETTRTVLPFQVSASVWVTSAAVR